jgi:hypothetical protein
MTDDLIKRIEQAEDAIGYSVDALEVQAERIAELEWQRDNNIRGCQCSEDEACAHVRRAEKAEADLAAARKALRHASDGPWHGEHDYRNWHEQHAPAIAAARGEQEKSHG